MPSGSPAVPLPPTANVLASLKTKPGYFRVDDAVHTLDAALSAVPALAALPVARRYLAHHVWPVTTAANAVLGVEREALHWLSPVWLPLQGTVVQHSIAKPGLAACPASVTPGALGGSIFRHSGWQSTVLRASSTRMLAPGFVGWETEPSDAMPWPVRVTVAVLRACQHGLGPAPKQHPLDEAIMPGAGWAAVLAGVRSVAGAEPELNAGDYITPVASVPGTTAVLDAPLGGHRLSTASALEPCQLAGVELHHLVTAILLALRAAGHAVQAWQLQPGPALPLSYVAARAACVPVGQRTAAQCAAIAGVLAQTHFSFAQLGARELADAAQLAQFRTAFPKDLLGMCDARPSFRVTLGSGLHYWPAAQAGQQLPALAAELDARGTGADQDPRLAPLRLPPGAAAGATWASCEAARCGPAPAPQLAALLRAVQSDPTHSLAFLHDLTCTDVRDALARSAEASSVRVQWPVAASIAASGPWPATPSKTPAAHMDSRGAEVADGADAPALVLGPAKHKACYACAKNPVPMLVVPVLELLQVLASAGMPASAWLPPREDNTVWQHMLDDGEDAHDLQPPVQPSWAAEAVRRGVRELWPSSRGDTLAQAEHCAWAGLMAACTACCPGARTPAGSLALAQALREFSPAFAHVPGRAVWPLAACLQLHTAHEYDALQAESEPLGQVFMPLLGSFSIHSGFTTAGGQASVQFPSPGSSQFQSPLAAAGAPGFSLLSTMSASLPGASPSSGPSVRPASRDARIPLHRAGVEGRARLWWLQRPAASSQFTDEDGAASDDDSAPLLSAAPPSWSQGSRWDLSDASPIQSMPTPALQSQHPDPDMSPLSWLLSHILQVPEIPADLSPGHVHSANERAYLACQHWGAEQGWLYPQDIGGWQLSGGAAAEPCLLPKCLNPGGDWWFRLQLTARTARASILAHSAGTWDGLCLYLAAPASALQRGYLDLGWQDELVSAPAAARVLIEHSALIPRLPAAVPMVAARLRHEVDFMRNLPHSAVQSLVPLMRFITMHSAEQACLEGDLSRVFFVILRGSFIVHKSGIPAPPASRALPGQASAAGLSASDLAAARARDTAQDGTQVGPAIALLNQGEHFGINALSFNFSSLQQSGKPGEDRTAQRKRQLAAMLQHMARRNASVLVASGTAVVACITRDSFLHAMQQAMSQKPPGSSYLQLLHAPRSASDAASMPHVAMPPAGRRGSLVLPTPVPRGVEHMFDVSISDDASTLTMDSDDELRLDGPKRARPPPLAFQSSSSQSSEDGEHAAELGTAPSRLRTGSLAAHSVVTDTASVADSQVLPGSTVAANAAAAATAASAAAATGPGDRSSQLLQTLRAALAGHPVASSWSPDRLQNLAANVPLKSVELPAGTVLQLKDNMQQWAYVVIDGVVGCFAASRGSSAELLQHAAEEVEPGSSVPTTRPTVSSLVAQHGAQAAADIIGSSCVAFVGASGIVNDAVLSPHLRSQARRRAQCSCVALTAVQLLAFSARVVYQCLANPDTAPAPLFAPARLCLPATCLEQKHAPSLHDLVGLGSFRVARPVDSAPSYDGAPASFRFIPPGSKSDKSVHERIVRAALRAVFHRAAWFDKADAELVEAAASTAKLSHFQAGNTAVHPGEPASRVHLLLGGELLMLGAGRAPSSKWHPPKPGAPARPQGSAPLATDVALLAAERNRDALPAAAPRDSSGRALPMVPLLTKDRVVQSAVAAQAVSKFTHAQLSAARQARAGLLSDARATASAAACAVPAPAAARAAGRGLLLVRRCQAGSVIGDCEAVLDLPNMTLAACVPLWCEEGAVVLSVPNLQFQPHLWPRAQAALAVSRAMLHLPHGIGQALDRDPAALAMLYYGCKLQELRGGELLGAQAWQPGQGPAPVSGASQPAPRALSVLLTGSAAARVTLPVPVPMTHPGHGGPSFRRVAMRTADEVQADQEKQQRQSAGTGPSSDSAPVDSSSREQFLPYVSRKPAPLQRVRALATVMRALNSAKRDAEDARKRGDTRTAAQRHADEDARAAELASLARASVGGRLGTSQAAESATGQREGSQPAFRIALEDAPARTPRMWQDLMAQSTAKRSCVGIAVQPSTRRQSLKAELNLEGGRPEADPAMSSAGFFAWQQAHQASRLTKKRWWDSPNVERAYATQRAGAAAHQGDTSAWRKGMLAKFKRDAQHRLARLDSAQFGVTDFSMASAADSMAARAHKQAAAAAAAAANKAQAAHASREAKACERAMLADTRIGGASNTGFQLVPAAVIRQQQLSTEKHTVDSSVQSCVRIGPAPPHGDAQRSRDELQPVVLSDEVVTVELAKLAGASAMAGVLLPREPVRGWPPLSELMSAPGRAMQLRVDSHAAVVMGVPVHLLFALPDEVQVAWGGALTCVLQTLQARLALVQQQLQASHVIPRLAQGTPMLVASNLAAAEPAAASPVPASSLAQPDGSAVQDTPGPSSEALPHPLARYAPRHTEGIAAVLTSSASVPLLRPHVSLSTAGARHAEVSTKRGPLVSGKRASSRGQTGDPGAALLPSSSAASLVAQAAARNPTLAPLASVDALAESKRGSTTRVETLRGSFQL